MAAHGPNRDKRTTNALAVVAGALIALIAVLAFLAVISHRGGAQERPGAVPAVGRAAPAYPGLRAGEALAAEVDLGLRSRG